MTSAGPTGRSAGSGASAISAEPEVAIVIPTIGRSSLGDLLASISASAAQTGGSVPIVVVVDDRPGTPRALTGLPRGLSVQVLHSGGRGPAAARNLGWRSVSARWIAFLDDDVLVDQNWLADLSGDLARAALSWVEAPGADRGSEVAGIQGRITVPIPRHRRPTDWERGTAGLETARWITADMAYRRDALQITGGFDERFPRAFREDADLALRVQREGYELRSGARRTVHPVRASPWWASVGQQRGNADDVLMQRIHGRGWRRRAVAPLGRRPQHLLTTASGLTALAAAVAGKRTTAAFAAAGWVGLTAEFALRRIAPGPRDRTEVAKMVGTSVAIPPAATWFWLRAVGTRTRTRIRLPDAVLVDRDGTIVKDVPYNGDPTLVQPMPGARAALDRLRRAGIPIAVVSNQSGIGRGLLSADSVAAVNARVEELLGPFDGWFVCPHTTQDGCSCRKPQPGLVHQAAQQLQVRADRCVLIGDIGADMSAAAAAGARGIIVPTDETLPEEVVAAAVTAETFGAAVDLVLTGAC